MPVISSEDGCWLLPSAGSPMLKPGGHGAIWKLMQDEGVFAWLAQQDRQGALVRQIRCRCSQVRSGSAWVAKAVAAAQGRYMALPWSCCGQTERE